MTSNAITNMTMVNADLGKQLIRLIGDVWRRSGQVPRTITPTDLLNEMINQLREAKQARKEGKA